MNGPSTEPESLYDLGGKRIAASSPALGQALMQAYQSRIRPRCLCRPDGLEMVIVRVGDGYYLRRMPHTGHLHASACPSYELPPEWSGGMPQLGRAISENPDTGEVRLKLDFSLSVRQTSTCKSASTDATPRARTTLPRLSMRDLLHWLWDRADLTRWHPGFAGRRHWFTVRDHLLRAAAGVSTASGVVLDQLYIPEVFSVEQRGACIERRHARWQQIAASEQGSQPLMILIAEVKELTEARFGHRLVLKHMPDLPLVIGASLYRRVTRAFAKELSLWAAHDDVHLILIATADAKATNGPRLQELALMPTNSTWIPAGDRTELDILGRLQYERRVFRTTLSLGTQASNPMPFAVLLDCGDAPEAIWKTLHNSPRMA